MPRDYKVGTRPPRGAGEGLSARSMPRRYLERPGLIGGFELGENGDDLRMRFLCCCIAGGQRAGAAPYEQ